jgi:hypothetical protein
MPRTDEQLIQSALGDPTFRLKGKPRESAGNIRLYENVELPQAFRRGFPPVWHFALLHRLHPAHRDLSASEKSLLVAEGLSIIRALPAYTAEPPPLAFLSDEPTIRLADELNAGRPGVYYLDEPELPSLRGQGDAKFPPLIMALRSSLRESGSELFLSPYVPNRPAQAWRFFGRRRELERLLYSPENFIVVGARRIGKTSLLFEAQRRFSELGVTTYYVNVFDVDNDEQFTNRLLYKLSPQDLISLNRRRQFVTERMLSTVLRRLSGRDRIVLLIDELGTVITNMRGNAWKVLGVLRDFAQTGKIKIIATSYQEFFEMQQRDITGPWLNFASTLRLSSFSREEIDELVIEPLTLWANVVQTAQLRELVKSAVGGHPLYLQYFSQAVFTEIVSGDSNDVLRAAGRVVGENLTQYFAEAIQETFFLVPSSTSRYLFLALCSKAAVKAQDLDKFLISDDTIDETLREAGISSTVQSRYDIMLDLEVRALTQPVAGDHAKQQIISPIIYRYFKREEDKLARMLEKYKGEMSHESRLLRLQQG